MVEAPLSPSASRVRRGSGSAPSFDFPAREVTGTAPALACGRDFKEGAIRTVSEQASSPATNGPLRPRAETGTAASAKGWFDWIGRIPATVVSRTAAGGFRGQVKATAPGHERQSR